jgi:ADP-ribose pyrophosphatase YjhB (NUDIX family)
MSDYIKWIRSKVGHDPIIFVASLAIIKDNNGKILLQKTSDKQGYSWGLPGGMIEPSESAEDTLKREVKEETGLDIEVDYFLGAYTSQPITEYKNGDKAHVICLVFVCNKKDGDLQTDDKETIELNFFEATKSKELTGSNGYMIEDFISGKKGIIR